MTSTEILTFILSVLSGVVGLTSIISFLTARKQRQRNEGAKDALVNSSLDTIKLQNETLLQGNRQICDKLDNQNIRLSKLEQTVENAKISTLPVQIASLDASLKSAHNRIDEINNKINHNNVREKE